MFSLNNHKVLGESSAALALVERAVESRNGEPTEQRLAETTKVDDKAFEGTVVVSPSCASDVARQVTRILTTSDRVKVLTTWGSVKSATYTCAVVDQASVISLLMKLPRGTAWDFELTSRRTRPW